MRLPTLLLAMCLCLTLPLTAAAHRMLAEAEPGVYLIRVTFDDGTPIQGATVTIRSLDNNAPVAQGHTNDQGKYYFEPPAPGVYQITARDEMGHRDRFKLVVDSGASLPTGAAGPDTGEMLFRAVAGFGYLAGFSALTWWFLNRRAAKRNSQHVGD